MNCPNCGGNTRLVEGRGYSTCDYCQTYVFPRVPAESLDRVIPLEQPHSANCPVCLTSMQMALLDATKVGYCPHCRGLLMSNDAFYAVVSTRRSQYQAEPETPIPFDRAELRRQLLCPQCAGRMEVYPYCGPGNTVMDSCFACRLVWLDHGELGVIERAPGKR